MAHDSATGPLNGWTFATVGVLTIAIVAISWMVIDRFDTAADVVAILAALIGPLAGIGAAAFGVKLSTEAKSQATAATEDRDRVKDATSVLADDLDRILDNTRNEAVRDTTGTAAVDVAGIERIASRLRDLGR